MATKKTTKKTAAKKATVKPAPVMEHKCECGENCRCHCHCGAHFVKHLIVWAIVFGLGIVVGQMLNFGEPKHHFKPMMHPVFTNGCVDMQAIDCPQMREDLLKADVNGDDCVSIEEYKATKQNKRPMHKKMHGFPKKK